MKDKFFTQEYCDRCGKSLKDGRIMSMLNTECICMKCSEKERKHPNFEKARDAEHELIKKNMANTNSISLSSEITLTLNHQYARLDQD